MSRKTPGGTCTFLMPLLLLLAELLVLTAPRALLPQIKCRATSRILTRWEEILVNVKPGQC